MNDRNSTAMKLEECHPKLDESTLVQSYEHWDCKSSGRSFQVGALSDISTSVILTALE